MINLNRLFIKWTSAVMAIATAIGKKIAMIGISNVPNPKPENRVSKDAKKAVMMMIIVILFS